MEDRVNSNLEIRRILLLTRLRTASKGVTMDQLVRGCEKVPGWNLSGKTAWDVVRLVLQTLIDDGLAAMRTRIVLTTKGREYLEDPFKWQIDKETAKEVERRLFWSTIYETFDRAYHRMRSRPEPTPGSKEADH